MQRIIAFTLAIICFACTLIILFGHIRSRQDLTVIHLYILVSFAVSIGAGYLMEHARVSTSIAFGAIFVIATGVCVVLSGSRSHASLEAKMREASLHNQARDELALRTEAAHKSLTQAQKLLDDYTRTINKSIEAAADQCSTGKGSRCAGHEQGVTLRTAREHQLTSARDAARDTFNKLTQSLHDTPAVTANPELAPLASLTAALFSLSEDKAMHVVITVLAYALAVLTEFSGITFMNFALSYRATPAASSAISPALTINSARAQPAAHTHATSVPDIPLADIARELKLDPRVARKRVRELGISKPVQGWSFPSTVAEDIKKRLSSVH
jgi:hypothetical protein